MNQIYLDNASTTKVHKEVADTVYETMTTYYGNPSSMHAKGLESYKIINKTRKTISQLISCEPECIYFTSGGTESNNLSINGIINKNNKSKNKIITSSVEHSSVIENIKKLKLNGFEIVYISPDKNGDIIPESIWEHVDENTALVSIMHINNETGDIYNIKKICQGVKLKNKQTIFHCDGVQAFGKININVSDLGVDIYTFSSHKIHGPKGTGGLYIKKGIPITPMIIGGSQELGIRCGTENVPGIAGFGKAIEMIDVKNSYPKIKNLYHILLCELKKIDFIHINSHKNSSYYVINFSVNNLKSEILLHNLESKGIYVSNGSACSKNKKSHVLKGMNIKDEYINSAIRVSFSNETTLEEITYLINTLKELKN